MPTPIIPQTSGIYMITCTVNGRIYVGSSINLNRRHIRHFSELRKNVHVNPHLQNAWNKYGETVFTFEVLELTASDELIWCEQHWIDSLYPFEPRGFNIRRRADRTEISNETKERMRVAHLGKKLSPEHREKLDIANKSRKGIKHTPEALKKISATSTGRPCSPETRKKISESSKGRLSSPETRQKQSDATRGKKTFRSAETKAKVSEAISKNWLVVSPDGVETEIRNLSEFCRQNGLNFPSMYAVVQGHQRLHKGWKCRHTDAG